MAIEFPKIQDLIPHFSFPDFLAERPSSSKDQYTNSNPSSGLFQKTLNAMDKLSYWGSFIAPGAMTAVGIMSSVGHVAADADHFSEDPSTENARTLLLGIMFLGITLGCVRGFRSEPKKQWPYTDTGRLDDKYETPWWGKVLGALDENLIGPIGREVARGLKRK